MARIEWERFVAHIHRGLFRHTVLHCVHGMPFLHDFDIVDQDGNLDMLFRVISVGAGIDPELELDFC